MRWARALRAGDVLLVVLLAASAQLQVWTADPDRWDDGRAVHAALAALITLPLFVRRRHPLPVLCVVAFASWLQYELGGGLGQVWLAFLLALYAVAAHAGRRDALLGAGVAAAVSIPDGLTKLRDGEPWEDVIPAWFFLAALWAFGRWMRRRRREMQQMHEQRALLEHEREEATRAAVADERSRIARELHDLVAHSMGVIVIQSQAAQRVLRKDVDAAQDALSSIETTGRQGMVEMRRLLDVLIGSEEDAPRAPQPGLRDLDALLERVRGAGLDVELSVEGEAGSLPPGIDLSAYRIVQEALTNTLRHAQATRACVRLRWTPDRVEVEVTDDGSSAVTETVGGHGLVGMRERVSLYGGTLQAGRRTDAGGFRVRARLPVDSRPAHPT
ncbi:MAG: hypothetical protein QOH75_1736 [Actinomycetota bacterium]|jgi:signal transduction histidine kinase|nr:hypothetical protein [Actinomycetota bacterium]